MIKKKIPCNIVSQCSCRYNVVCNYNGSDSFYFFRRTLRPGGSHFCFFGQSEIFFELNEKMNDLVFLLHLVHLICVNKLKFCTH